MFGLPDWPGQHMSKSEGNTLCDDEQGFAVQARPQTQPPMSWSPQVQQMMHMNMMQGMVPMGMPGMQHMMQPTIAVQTVPPQVQRRAKQENDCGALNIGSQVSGPKNARV